MKEQAKLKSVDLALSLLSYFSLEKPVWGVRELAQHLGKHPSVIQRALSSLETHALLRKTENANYSLGIKCIELGLIAEAKMDVVHRLEQCLQPLVEEIGHSVFFYRQEHDAAVCSFVLESQRAFNFNARLGHKLTLDAAPFSQIILAYQSDDFIQEYMAEHEIDDPIIFMGHLAELNSRGYAYSKEVLFKGTHGVAVPVFNLKNQVVGALCMASLLNEDEDIEKYAARLQQASESIKFIFS